MILLKSIAHNWTKSIKKSNPSTNQIFAIDLKEYMMLSILFQKIHLIVDSVTL